MFRRFSMVGTKPCEAWPSSPFYGRIPQGGLQPFLSFLDVSGDIFNRAKMHQLDEFGAPPQANRIFLGLLTSAVLSQKCIGYPSIYIYIYKVIHKSTYWVCWELVFTPKGNVNGNNCNYWILGVIALCSDKPIYIYIHIHVEYVYTIKGPRLPKLIMTLSSRLTAARAHSSVRVAAMFLRSMSKGPLKKNVV